MAATKTSASKRTIDHDTIRRWAEDRNGKPATVAETQHREEPGILRIDFPGYSGEESLKHISWEDFFEKFESANLAMIYQDETTSGEKSRFCKFVDRQASEDNESA